MPPCVPSVAKLYVVPFKTTLIVRMFGSGLATGVGILSLYSDPFSSVVTSRVVSVISVRVLGLLGA